MIKIYFIDLNSLTHFVNARIKKKYFKFYMI
jgi:hypothetical protein